MRRAASNIAGILVEAGWVIKDFIVADADIEDGVEIESYLSPIRTKAEEDDPRAFSELLRADAGKERQSLFLATQLEKVLVSSNWEVPPIHKSRRGELSENTIRVNVGLKDLRYHSNPQTQAMKQRFRDTMRKVRADMWKREEEMEELRKKMESDPRYQELMKPKPPLVLRPPEEPEQPNRTRLSAGSVLMLEKLLDAENWSPTFEGFIFACFPTDKLRGNLDTRFQVEAQGSFVIENDFDNVVVG